MTEEKLIKELSGIVNHNDIFKTIAINMNWIGIDEIHEDWYWNYPIGIMIDLYHFPIGYVEKYFKECYVQCRLAEIAYYEQWERDYFNVSKKEREEQMKYTYIYRYVNTYKDLRLAPISCEELKKEIEFYAAMNGVTKEEQKRFYTYIEGAGIVDIGGCYGGEHYYIAVQQDTILTVDCGIWD
ncbi:MAG: hypothetical protein HDT30_00865 [Clostridiales bacterium]|nr:hypothetical protein [Clostridiales bacterium]